ncbi:unnamed protein product [Sphagnum tenellum]
MLEPLSMMEVVSSSAPYQAVCVGAYLWKYPHEGAVPASRREPDLYPRKCNLCHAVLYDGDDQITVSEVTGSLRWSGERGEEEEGSLSLSEVSLLSRGIHTLSGSIPLTLTIVTPNRNVILKADNREIASQWFEGLREAIFEIGNPPRHLALNSIQRAIYNGDEKSVVDILNVASGYGKEVLVRMERLEGGKSLLEEAVRTKRSAAMTGALIGSGCNGAEIGDDGYSLVHVAAGNGDELILTELLKDPRANRVLNIAGPDSYSPLHAAVFSVSPNCVELLLGKGSNPGIQDAYCRSALHWAAESGDASIVSHLLSWTEEDTVNGADNEGNTPLHIACANGHYQVVSLLLETAANPLVTNQNKLSPISVAIPLGYKEIEELLQKYGGGGFYPPGINFDMFSPKSASPYLPQPNSSRPNSDIWDQSPPLLQMRESPMRPSPVTPYNLSHGPVDSTFSPASSPTYQARQDRKSQPPPEEIVFAVRENSKKPASRIDKNLLSVPISPLNVLRNLDKERRIGKPVSDINEKLLKERKEAREKRRTARAHKKK